MKSLPDPFKQNTNRGRGNPGAHFICLVHAVYAMCDLATQSIRVSLQTRRRILMTGAYSVRILVAYNTKGDKL